VTQNLFMGGGSEATDRVVSVSERMMGEDGLVMAGTVLTLVMMGTKSSCVSLSSVSR